MDSMNQPSEELNQHALAIVPEKRKRGRPRKSPTADDPNFNLGGSKFRAPPGFRESNRKQTCQTNRIRTAKDNMAGQLVSGIIESEFEGGYLLRVKVCNSDITLRGVVFKPGCCDPITAENDVAPNVHMVHRNKVPLSSRVSKYRSRGRHRVSNPPLSTGIVALESTLACPPTATAQAIVPSRGNVVPVVLQSIVASSSNEAPFLNQCGLFGTQEALPVTLQRQVPSNRSEAVAAQQPLGQEKASSPELDVKPVRPTGMRYMNAMKDIISNRLHIEDEEHSTEAIPKSGITMEAEGVSNMNLHQQQHMFMDPFQSLQHFTMNSLNAVPSPSDRDRSGKMTKLLQAVQENAMKNQMH